MLDPNNWYVRMSQPLECFDPTVPGKNYVVGIDDERSDNVKLLDSLGELIDIPIRMVPYVPRVRSELADRDMANLVFRRRSGLFARLRKSCPGHGSAFASLTAPY
jgi:hypothetical protein